MALVHDPMKCGGCGGEPHKILNVRRSDEGENGLGELPGRLRVVCLGCGSVTEIGVSSALCLFDISGDGSLCGRWGDAGETTTEAEIDEEPRQIKRRVRDLPALQTTGTLCGMAIVVAVTYFLIVSLLHHLK